MAASRNRDPAQTRSPDQHSVIVGQDVSGLTVIARPNRRERPCRRTPEPNSHEAGLWAGSRTASPRRLMVPAAIPFAVVAAFFPAAVAVMLWLLAAPPRLRRGVVYLAGAATSTVGSGAVILALLDGVDAAPGRRATIEGAVQIILGGAFVLYAVGLLVRRPRLATPDPAGPPPKLRRGGYAGIFLLGLAMWTPSFAYVAAIDLIVDSGRSLPAQVLNLLLVDIIILAPVEVPLLLYGAAPGAVIAVVTKIDALVRRYFWQLGTITAGAGGTYLVVRGYLQLSP